MFRCSDAFVDLFASCSKLYVLHVPSLTVAFSGCIGEREGEAET